MTLILRILVLIAAIQQFAFPIFVNPFRDGGRGLSTTTPIPLTSSQIEPAGYAFAIWGPIYLLAIAYAVWQLTPSAAPTQPPAASRLSPLSSTPGPACGSRLSPLDRCGRQCPSSRSWRHVPALR